MPAGSTKRAGLYARVSSKDQAEGRSIQTQLEVMRAHADANGWIAVGEYSDPGFSGGRMDRPGLQRLIADVESGRLDVVVVNWQDRIARAEWLLFPLIHRFDELGVRLVSVSEGWDTGNQDDRLVMSLTGVLSAEERRKTGQKIKVGKRARARAGRSNASTTPYGYRREKHATWQDEEGETHYILLDPKPDPETSPAVVLAFETYATGEHSDTTVAEILNRAGYEPSGRAKSGRWTREGVRYMLTNQFYAGWVRHGNVPHPGQHEPLVTQELWDQVQAVRAQRRRGKAAGRKANRVYLLARIARCSHCGLKLVSQTSGGKGRRGAAIPYHYCPSRRRAMDCPTQGSWIRVDVVEPQVARLVERLQLPADWRDRLEELSNHREERENVEGRRRYLQGKLRRLRELYLDGDFDRGEYARRKAELQAQLDVLRVPETPDVEQAGEVLESLGAEWAQAPKPLQRDMLRTIFEAIFMDVLSKKVVSVKPYPSFMPLFRMDGLTEGKDGLFYVGEGEQEAGSEDREVA